MLGAPMVDHGKPAVKPVAFPTSRSFSPDDLPPGPAVSASLRHAGPRVAFRLRLLWDEAGKPREELIALRNPRKVLDLWREVCSTPHRPLLSAAIEAQAAPRWELVG